MTYEELQKANTLIKTTDVKGKDYAEVNQRIKAFRSVYPEGFIVTNLLIDEDGKCVFVAECGYYVGDAKIVLGTGTAYEKESSSYINKTSYIENCETSAVGRALGMCGFGIDTSIASAEEVESAMFEQMQIKARENSNFQEFPKEVKKKKPTWKQFIQGDEMFAEAMSTNIPMGGEIGTISIATLLKDHKDIVDKTITDYPEFKEKIIYCQNKKEEFTKL